MEDRKINKRRELNPGPLAALLITPSFLVVFVVSVIPILLALGLSFTEAQVQSGGIQWEFIGWENYVRFLGKGTFWESLRVTSFFTLISLAVEMIIGTVIALVLNQTFVGRPIVRSLILIPWALPTVVNARMWSWIYDGHAYGALNGLLLSLGLIDHEVVWLQNTVPLAGWPLVGNILQWCGDSTALNMIIIADTWKVTPLIALLLLAGLQTIPQDYYEAAKVDGAGAWTRFWHITFPHLKPIFLVVLVLRTMELFRVFDILWIIMGNTIKVLSIYTFEQGMVFGRLGRGAALSFMIGLLILLLSVVYSWLLHDRGEE